MFYIRGLLNDSHFVSLKGIRSERNETSMAVVREETDVHFAKHWQKEDIVVDHVTFEVHRQERFIYVRFSLTSFNPAVVRRFDDDNIDLSNQYIISTTNDFFLSKGQDETSSDGTILQVTW